MKGIILRTVGGFFYVFVLEKRIIYECSVRRRLENKGIELLVGDKVEISLRPEKKSGVIEKMLPRRSKFLRPAVANIDQVVIVTALDNPGVNFYLLDRLLALTEYLNLLPLIVLNKTDLRTDNKERVLKGIEYYHKLGYNLIKTSVIDEKGLDSLLKALTGHISVFAGESGVGKSALLNLINPEWERRTYPVSEKSKRGRHTTTQVELLNLDNTGFVADSPGFMRLDISIIEPEELSFYFREIYDYIGNCRFNGCDHHEEPGCAVKNAVESDEICGKRYENYLKMLKELYTKKENKY